MVPVPVQERLAEHRLFATTSLDEARDIVARVFCPHRLTTTSADGRIDTTHNMVQLESISLNYLDYGATVNITPGELTSFFLVQIPLSGSARVQCGAETVVASPTLATIPSPTLPLDMTWSNDSPHLLVHMNREVLESKLSELMNCSLRTPLQFTLGVDLSDGHLQAWRGIIDLLVADAEDPKLHPTVRAHMEELVMIGLLTGQHHNYTHCIDSSAEPAAPRSVRRAMDACESDTQGISSVSDLAQIAGVSIRSLQEGFKNSVGMTPMEYLREVRLRRARKDLMAAGPGTKVADIANKWGFTHLGRFSQVYSHRFGECPSESLRRIR